MSISGKNWLDRGAAYSCHVEAIVEDIRSLPEECCQSGGRFDNVWDEFVDQLRQGESVFFEAYEQAVRQVCRSRVVRMEEAEKRWLLAGTDGSPGGDGGPAPSADELDEVITEELYCRVFTRADLESLEDLRECGEEEPEEEEREEDEADEEADRNVYLYDRRGWELISQATALFRKVAASPAAEPLQLLSVAKALQVLEAMPRAFPLDCSLALTVTFPEFREGEVTTGLYFTFDLQDGEIVLNYSGHTYDPAVGGDSFTCRRLQLWPNDEADLLDDMDRCYWVPGVVSLGEAVEELDLTESPLPLEIADEDDPFILACSDVDM